MNTGCLRISIDNITPIINLGVEHLGALSVCGSRLGTPISVTVTEATDIEISIHRVGRGLSISCGLVCSFADIAKLAVSPEHIFLMPGNNFTDDVLVMSNIEWQVL